jgi:transglutaminase-like putative cysteine protease
MRYLIEHRTHLEFPQAIREHHCELRVVPRSVDDQHVHGVRIEVEPAASLFRYTDCFGNVVHHFSVIEAHASLTTRVEIDVETSMQNPFDYKPIEPRRERAWIADALHTTPRLWDFVLHRNEAVADIEPFAADYDLPQYDNERPLIESVQRAMSWIRSNFVYNANVTHVHSTLAEVLEARAGVCQDFAHLMVAIVRSWGYPARYIMGYQDPGYLLGGTQGREATHAWTEVLIPGAGWRGFDATNGLLADHTYVRVAVGRDYGDAAPQRGSFKGDRNGEDPEVELRVVRQQ